MPRSSASAVLPDSSMAASASLVRSGSGAEAQPLGTRLHDHDRHRVRDHVVHLAGDAVPFGLRAVGRRGPRLDLEQRGSGRVLGAAISVRRRTNVPAAHARPRASRARSRPRALLGDDPRRPSQRRGQHRGRDRPAARVRDDAV